MTPKQQHIAAMEASLIAAQRYFDENGVIYSYEICDKWSNMDFKALSHKPYHVLEKHLYDKEKNQITGDYYERKD